MTYTHFIATGKSKQDDISAINRLAFFESEAEAREALAAYPAFRDMEWFDNPRIVSEAEAIDHVYGQANFECKKRNQHYYWHGGIKKWMWF